MAHTPQALVFPHAHRAGSAPYAALDDATLERAAAQIQPTWSAADAPPGNARGQDSDEEAWPVPRALELAAAGRLPVHTVRPPDEAHDARPLPDARRRLDFGGDSHAMPIADHTAPKLSLACDFTDGFPLVTKRRSSMRWIALALLTLAGGVWAATEGRIQLPWLSAEPSAAKMSAPSAQTAPRAGVEERAVQGSTGEAEPLPRGIEPPPAEAVNEPPTRQAAAPVGTTAEAPRRAAKRKRGAPAARPKRMAKHAGGGPRPPTFEDFFPDERPATARAPLGRASVADNPY